MSIHEPDQRPYDEVQLRARRDGDSMAVQLTRATAMDRAEELRAEGWDVELIETEPSR